MGIEPSPVYLAPSFFVTFWLYDSYPLELTGEVVELMLGLGFLLSLLQIHQHFEPRKSPIRLRAALGVSWAVTLLIGFVVPSLTIAAMGVDPTKIRAAEREVSALRLDFLTLSGRAGRLATKCGQHKRVYSYVEKYEASRLLERTFAALQEEGLEKERARYFLDPWNNPYWIRHKCNRKKKLARVFVYSFGSNRKRDSTDWELRSDDIGRMIAQKGERTDGT